MKKMKVKRFKCIVASMLTVFMFSSMLISPSEAEGAVYASYKLTSSGYVTTSYFQSSGAVTYDSSRFTVSNQESQTSIEQVPSTSTHADSSSDSNYSIVSSAGITYKFYPETNTYKRVDPTSSTGTTTTTSTSTTTQKPTVSNPAPTVVSKPPVQSNQQSVKVETVAKGTKYATDLYVIKSGKPGPVVMVVGGVHGNEKAGYTAAHKVADYTITKGTLLVLPEANIRAVDANRRYISAEGDLNRDFPTTKNGSADGVLAKAILKTMKDYKVDWVMDMHEGANYSKLSSSNSVGQSIIYYPSTEMTGLAKDIVNQLNKGISTSYKQFSLLKYPIKGSLARAAAVSCGANSFIFETCSKEPLSTRVNNQIKAVNMLLDHLNMR